MSADTTGPNSPAAELWKRWRGKVVAWFLAAIACCVPAAFFESFHGLMIWCDRNGLGGIYAWFAPSMVDVVILAGEVVLLLAIMEDWDAWAHVAGWAAIVLGLAVSVAGNTGRDGWTQPIAHMITFAIAPVALTGLTALGLLVTKRYLHPAEDAGIAVSEDLLIALLRYGDHARAGTLPTFEQVKADLSCGNPRARRVRACLAVSAPLAASMNGQLSGVPS